MVLVSVSRRIRPLRGMTDANENFSHECLNHTFPVDAGPCPTSSAVEMLQNMQTNSQSSLIVRGSPSHGSGCTATEEGKKN